MKTRRLSKSSQVMLSGSGLINSEKLHLFTKMSNFLAKELGGVEAAYKEIGLRKSVHWNLNNGIGLTASSGKKILAAYNRVKMKVVVTNGE